MIKDLQYIHTMEYYLEIKRNELWIQAIYMNLRSTVLSKRSWPERLHMV